MKFKRKYPEAYKSYEWDRSIIPDFEFKNIMRIAVFLAALIIIFIALNTGSEILNGPYSWWPFIPFIGIFVFVWIASKNIKCGICKSKLLFNQLDYQEDFELGLEQTKESIKYPRSEWGKCYVHIYTCEKCKKHAIGDVSQGD